MNILYHDFIVYFDAPHRKKIEKQSIGNHRIDLLLNAPRAPSIKTGNSPRQGHLSCIVVIEYGHSLILMPLWAQLVPMPL